jgi:hypothetical protein
MGYTHYWYRPEVLDSDTFTAFARDCGAIFKVATAAGLHLAGGLGDSDPVADPTHIWFNGASACGHQNPGPLGIPWPAPRASGIETEVDATAGTWFGGLGTLLSSRQCTGDCSYETFGLARVTERNPWQDGPLVFAYCKTAYRPYDVVVTAVLIAFKRHFGDLVTVASDGNDANWDDGRILAEVAVGYGKAFHLSAGPDGEQALWGPSAASEGRVLR